MVTAQDPTRLPADLPVPIDDGAAVHLPGLRLPPVALPATSGGEVDLARASDGRTVVVFCYPKTGRPGVEMPPGWDDIPGARGCTPEACAFRDLKADFDDLGAGLYGLSTQTPDYQREAAERLHLSYPLLSDARLRLTGALRLPIMTIADETLIRRTTLILRDGAIETVFYPVFPPDGHPSEVLRRLRGDRRPG